MHETPPASAAEWLRRGQACEALGTPEALAEAVRCHDEAVGMLLSSFTTKPARPGLARELAIAWMNRGNALQKQPRAESLAQAVASYDRAIELLRPPPADDAGRNSLGAAWLNRGQALHRQGTPAALTEALRSQREAIALLRTLPLAADPAFRCNLAGALVNEANLLLDDGFGRHQESRRSARSSLALVLADETARPVAAILGLQARRALCDAIGRLLLANTSGLTLSELADEAGDAVDDGLALARLWERRGCPDLRPLAERLFVFGARLYRGYQPQFLAEFILENLDPAHSPGALPGPPALHTFAGGMIAGALDTLRGVQRLTADDAASSRLLQTWRELQAAEARLGELRLIAKGESRGRAPSG
ncbi:MAG TPA: tetratricopeptide repeat protein [Opitutaceae bacterium]|nr:tetratricopeptide repeat protein [Opitutaceae bacterium]